MIVLSERSPLPVNCPLPFNGDIRTIFGINQGPLNNTLSEKGIIGQVHGIIGQTGTPEQRGTLFNREGDIAFEIDRAGEVSPGRNNNLSAVVPAALINCSLDCLRT